MVDKVIALVKNSNKNDFTQKLFNLHKMLALKKANCEFELQKYIYYKYNII